MQSLIVTNNPTVYTDSQIISAKEFVDSTSMLAVLIRVRDLIHDGHSLLSHPLSGSLKPNENPFKSILVSHGIKGNNYDHIVMIENAIETCQKFLRNKTLPVYSERIINDFMYVDKTIIESGLKN